MSHFLKLVNNKKLCIRTRVRANALIVCMDKIEKEHCIKLSDLYEIYATESLKEFRISNMSNVPTFKYKANDARIASCFSL